MHALAGDGSVEHRWMGSVEGASPHMHTCMSNTWAVKPHASIVCWQVRTRPAHQRMTMHVATREAELLLTGLCFRVHSVILDKSTKLPDTT
jgi:hypothetical protein